MVFGMMTLVSSLTLATSLGQGDLDDEKKARSRPDAATPKQMKLWVSELASTDDKVVQDRMNLLGKAYPASRNALIEGVAATSREPVRNTSLRILVNRMDVRNCVTMKRLTQG